MRPLSKQECIDILIYNNFDIDFKTINYGYVDEDNKTHIFYTDQYDEEKVIVF